MPSLRQTAVSLLALLFITPALIISESNAVFVIYGLPTCPYCNYQKDFFNNAKMNCVFIDASIRSQSYYEIVSATGLEYYVPVTVVINRDGYVTAVVQGLVSEESFWINLTQRDPREGISIYIGEEFVRLINETSRISVLNDVVHRDISELLNQTTTSIETGTPTTTPPQQLFELLKAVALLIAIIALFIVPIIIFRIRKTLSPLSPELSLLKP